MADKPTDEQETANEELEVEQMDSAQAAETADEVDPTEPEEAVDPLAAALAEVESLKEQLNEAKDQSLRAAAEAQNVRRRSEKDVENAHKFGLEKFCGELLAVVDNLERAQQQADTDSEAVKPLMEGVELTYKSFVDVMAKFKLEQLDPHGEPFDPQLHQAITMLENPDSEPNTVIDVMQKGYTLHGRLIRPAMVVVSK